MANYRHIYYPKPDVAAKKSINEKVTVRQAWDEAAFLRTFYENDTKSILSAENAKQVNKLAEHSQTTYADAVFQSEQEKKDKTKNEDSSDEEEVD